MKRTAACSEDEITHPSPKTYSARLEQGGGIIKAVIPSGECQYYIKRRERPEILTIIPECNYCTKSMTVVNKTEQYRTITMQALRKRHDSESAKK